MSAPVSEPTLRDVLARALHRQHGGPAPWPGRRTSHAFALDLLRDPALAAAERVLAAAVAFRKTKFVDLQYGPLTEELVVAIDAYRSAVEAA